MRPLSNQEIQLANRLTYSGTLPLLVCAVGFYTQTSWLNFQAAAIAYAMLIIAFLSGIHWAIYLSAAKRCPLNLFLRSNATTLLAYTTFFIPQASICLAIELVCFLLLLHWDKTLQRLGILPLWYYQLRRNATLMVSVILLSLIYP